MRAPLRMDLRKRDLLSASIALLGARRARRTLPLLARRWKSLGGGERPLLCLSVRSAFDLFLQARALPRGSEVAISAMTHPDMPWLIRQHGLVPVPIDIEAATMAPAIADIERVLSPRTGAVLLTHLLGGRGNGQQNARWCAARGIELWEDCAQFFPPIEAATALSEVRLYSFGPMKTSTALAGAIADVRSARLRDKMYALQSQYPVQARWQMALRTGRYAALAGLGAQPWAYGALVSAASVAGIDVASLLRTVIKSFGNNTQLQTLRRRPSPVTLQLIAYRLRRGTSHAEKRGLVAEQLMAALQPLQVLGSRAASNHWLLVLQLSNPQDARAALRAVGYDSLVGLSGLAVVPAPEQRPNSTPRRSEQILRRALVVPLHPDYKPRDVARIAASLKSFSLSRVNATGPQLPERQTTCSVI